MKKLNVSPPAEVALTVEGNSIKVVSLSLPQRAQIGAAEERLAWRIARKDLESEKAELEAEPFDPLAWVMRWYFVNHITPLKEEVNSLMMRIEYYDPTNPGFDSLETLSRRLDSKQKQILASEAIYNNSNSRFSTIYAEANNGKKPPQSLYEVLVKEKAESYAIYAICHYFIRDAETGEMFFIPENDFKNVSYSPERAILNEWLTTNKQLQELVRECNYGTLMGFIEAKAQAKKAQELQKTQDNGVNELLLPEHVDTE